MRNIGLFITRAILGSYLAVHGAQELFGSFGGHGLEATGSGFDSMGLRPKKLMATVAEVSELGGGLLTATGIADPLGPLAIAGTMASGLDSAPQTRCTVVEWRIRAPADEPRSGQCPARVRAGQASARAARVQVADEGGRRGRAGNGRRGNIAAVAVQAGGGGRN